MARSTRTILWLFVAALIAISVSAVSWFVVKRLGRSDPDRLIGTWEGSGDERTQLTAHVGDGPQKIPLGLHVESRIVFHRGGKLEWSFEAKNEGFNLSIQVPDPKKPEADPRWELVRADRHELVVRLIGPDGPEYKIVFNGNDEFTMTPLDPTKGTTGIVHRRVASPSSLRERKRLNRDLA